MKLNNKGFAASGVLYTLLLLFLVLIISLLSMFSNRKLILSQLKKSIINSTYKKYENGTIIYFNPTTGLKCNIEDYNQNVDENGVVIGSNSGTKDGCMKWYTFNDNEKSEKVSLLLDHNIAPSIAYESNDNINEKLLSLTGEWNEKISDIELLSVNDIKKITNNLNFDISQISNKYYFETNTDESPTEYKNYGWLYDRTGSSCKKTGCKNNSSDEITGYFTSNTTGDKVWVINNDGSLITTDFTTNTYGLRPVITITKAMIHFENNEYEKDMIDPILLKANLEKLGKINYKIQDKESGLKEYCVNNSKEDDDCVWTTVTNTTEEFSFVYNATKVGDYYIHIKDNYDNIYTSTSPIKVTNENMCEYDVNKTWTFAYKELNGHGVEQTFKAPCKATYKLETWGAQGGNISTYIGGYGAYSVGNVSLDNKQTLHIVIGGKGNEASSASEITGGYNGGGISKRIDVDSRGVGSGGGATHIAKKSGLLSSLSSSLSDILIVSGGGGGAANPYYSSDNYYASNGGHAGGYIGGDATGYSGFQSNDYWTPCKGGTQNQITTSRYGGEGKNAFLSNLGNFGQGGYYNNVNSSSSGGGGGYYGGDGCRNFGGGGGSGYIGNSLLTDKGMYCYNCAESNNADTKTVSTTNVSETPTANYAKIGNGYAKITLVSFD